MPRSGPAWSCRSSTSPTSGEARSANATTAWTRPSRAPAFGRAGDFVHLVARRDVHLHVDRAVDAVRARVGGELPDGVVASQRLRSHRRCAGPAVPKATACDGATRCG